MDEDIYGLSAGEALNRIKSAQGAGADIYSMPASEVLKRLKKKIHLIYMLLLKRVIKKYIMVEA
jgi:hypothetical protein